jgi:hypothetical protein
MEIIKGYDVRVSNYDKKTPVFLKKVADFLLATILVVDPLMISLPEFQGKEWLLWGWNAFVVLFKFATKTVTEKVL